MNSINFDKKKLKDFKQKYIEAKKNQQETFFFEDKEVLVGYAKYMIEYLEGELK